MWEVIAGYAVGRWDQNRRAQNEINQLNQYYNQLEYELQEQYDAQMLMAQELQYAMSTPELTDEALGNEIYLAMQQMMIPVIEMFAGMIYADGEIDQGELDLGYGLIVQIMQQHLNPELYEEIIDEFDGMAQQSRMAKAKKSAKDFYDSTMAEFEDEDIEPEEWGYVVVALGIVGLSDMDLTDSERKYLVQIGKVFKLSEEEVNDLINESIEHAKEIVEQPQLTVSQEIEKAGELLEKGLITQEEFEKIKSDLI
tara:strand:+ start:467 stop:1228 length:762 start_codon:yes stop_codon:yes gene_type:complete